MKVRFTENYDYTPSADPRISIAFLSDGGPRKDGTYVVRRECGEAAIAAGRAEDLTFNGADPDAFDHDRDGEPGGAKVSADAEA
jgi:hypothetical protein